MKKSFYVTLPNSKHIEDFSKLGDYTTKLSSRFNLGKNWEVALTEISYPRSWPNIPHDQYVEFIYFDETNPNYIGITDKIIIKARDYNKDELVTIVNNAFSNLQANIKHLGRVSHPPKIGISNINQMYLYCGVINDKQRFFPRFSKILGNILGITEECIDRQINADFSAYKNKIIGSDLNYQFQEHNSAHVFYGTFTYSETQAINYLDKFLITSDLISNHHIGDSKTNVLRYITIPPPPGMTSNEPNIVYQTNCMQNTIAFDKPYYLPVIKPVFDSINIKFIDENSGDIIPFISGNVYVTLHFRSDDKSDPTHETESDETPLVDDELQKSKKKPIQPINP